MKVNGADIKVTLKKDGDTDLRQTMRQNLKKAQRFGMVVPIIILKIKINKKDAKMDETCITKRVII